MAISTSLSHSKDLYQLDSKLYKPRLPRTTEIMPNFPPNDIASSYRGTNASIGIVSEDRPGPAGALDKSSAADAPAVNMYRSTAIMPSRTPSMSGSLASPSPPPPAPTPAPVPSHVPDIPDQAPVPVSRPGRNTEAPPSYASCTASRSYASVLPWSVPTPSSSTSSEANAVYALERLHAAALALYNHVGEQLSVQHSMMRQEDVHTLLPLVSDINQEVRTLMSAYDYRAGRDVVDMAPYYPWMPNSSTSPYYSPVVSDERDSKLMRMDDDPLGTVRRRNIGQRNKAGSKYAARPDARVTSSTDDLIFAARLHGAHSSYAASANAYGKAATHEPSQPPAHMPKYRKRSRAPAPGVCHSCGHSDTPEWRRGPEGARTLCNACGLHFAKLVRRRTLEYANAAPGTPIPPVTIAELRQSTNVDVRSSSVAPMNDERVRIGSIKGSAVCSYDETAPSDPSRTPHTSHERALVDAPHDAPSTMQTVSSETAEQ